MSRHIVATHTPPASTKSIIRRFDTARETREWVWDQLSTIRNSHNLTTCRQIVNAIGNPMMFINDITVHGHRIEIRLYDVLPLDVKVRLIEEYGKAVHEYDQLLPVFQKPTC